MGVKGLELTLGGFFKGDMESYPGYACVLYRKKPLLNTHVSVTNIIYILHLLFILPLEVRIYIVPMEVPINLIYNKMCDKLSEMENYNELWST